MPLNPEKLAIVVPAYNEPDINRTLGGLYSQDQRNNWTHHFVVDNGSTDDTRARIDAFIQDHDDFPLTVIEEEQKGTGAAADTGFSTAAEQGYLVLARTDADTIPAPSWTTRISHNFHATPNLQLLGGRIVPIRDEHYRKGDQLLLPMAVKAARVALGIKNLDSDYLKAVTGANMATTADAYELTGGFERSSIDSIDEDIEYSLKVARSYGVSAVKFDRKLEVQTSMRRIREYGVGGTALHHLFPELRKRRKDGVDVR